MTSALPHLVRRFFGVLRAAPLGPADQTEAAVLLREAESGLFWGQPRADQRHGLECARAVLAACPGRRDLARAALLHDVGKRHAGLGPVGRALATTLGFLHLPAPGRAAAYLAHTSSGAADLAAAGAEPLVVAYARHHHTGRPGSITPEDWAALCRADHA
ncbi:MAG: hypothetical protein JW785_11785 [Acidimicrobiia bacterium]|nr:hypothetical protein [Acidimicrobiia bacterium]